MQKSYALFGIAGALVVGAALLEYLSQRPPPKDPVTAPPQGHIRPTANPPSSKAGVHNLVYGDLVKLQAQLSHSHLASSEAQELFLRINLDAAKVPSTVRGPLALAIVIDRSGSMDGEKMERTRTAAKKLVDRLSDTDRLSIVTYSTEHEVNLPLAEVGRAGRARIHEIIDSLFVGGGTNLSAGLRAGLDQVLEAKNENLIRRVVLMSDGNANQGETDPNVLGRIAQNSRVRGTTVTTLGVGVDFNEDLMTLLAEMGGGAYYYAKDGSAVATALEKEFDGLVALAARGVEVGLRLHPGVDVKEVYGYPTEFRKGEVVIPVGDVASREHRQIVVRLGVMANAEGVKPVTDVVLRYRPATSRTEQHHQGLLSVVVTTDPSQVESGAQASVLEQVEEIQAANARKEAAAHFSSGNRTQANQRLRKQLVKTRRMAKSYNSAPLMEQVKELENALRDVDTLSVSSEAGKDLVKREKHRAGQLFRY